MTGERQNYTVTIFEEPYSLVSDEGYESVASSAHRVDELMKTIASKLQSNDVKRIAVLAALKLAHELKTMESRMAKQKQEESHLIDYINKELSSLP